MVSKVREESKSMNKWRNIDIEAIKSLKKCTFLPGNYNKRFVRRMNTLALRDEQMSDRQLVNLWRLVWRYRRQHKDEQLIDLAYAMLSVGALFAWMRRPQEPPPGSIVCKRPGPFEARRKAELERLAQWNAG